MVIAAIVLLNGVLGYLQEARASRAVAELSRLAEVSCSVRRDGRLQRIAASDLVRDDILVLAEGDAVGADARLIEANALRIQEATLTGESESVLKQTQCLESATALADRVNMVYKGTAVAQGTGWPWSPPPAWQPRWGRLPGCSKPPRKKSRRCNARSTGSVGPSRSPCW
ncbi:MAG: hypothetical protein R3E68_09955 [Burkholderiaceae bacterium]